MALILPKGIVVNSPQIGSTIERFKNDPLDLADIARFWKVYTTTKRRLLDPTAERLENYWWRIWGSRRRELDASTVARLFVHISEGDTVVPLRGPPNRYEPEAPMNSAAYIGKTASTTSVARARNESRPRTTPTSVAKTSAPMPPPILKKTRGPSGNGPRPTARFISPAASEDESGSANKQVVVQSPPPPLEQTSTIDEKIEKEKVDKKLMPAPASKKFVASAAKKKRPVVVRRQSSQTSQSSNDSSARLAGGQGQQNRNLGRPPPLSVPPTRNQNTQENVVPTRSTTSPTKRNPSKLAAPARGGSRKLASTREEIVEVAPAQPTQPAQIVQTVQTAQPAQTVQLAQPAQPIQPAQPVPSNDLQTLVSNQVPTQVVSEAEFKVQRMLLDNAKTASILPPGPPSPDSQASITSRDSSNGKPPGYRKTSGKHLLQQQSKGMVSSAPTLTDATGHLDLGTGSQNTTVPASPERPGKGKARTLMKDLFTKKSMPQVVSPIAQPVSTPPGSPGNLSKSKSQLSLLLERDQARSLESKASLNNKGKQSMK
ncbi:hypothetical protein SS1G_03292 [Sclerotinia sclerotiorum 1980 UF-70]|uniref:Nitrogen regulatory protein areA GATA-like domain-containing protein n=2 Tax=Sclerotinia sclerotiorum (strain ATCC 18683 / 1980 / Ss-1) TaxID=665079 RepID=A7EDA2_SCLS1|nr:hypothetical protein SS1G_03292 [Sclerotinia sclerotiorum 1980 UF-70]APA11006.1 hypothetical protein sscle_07g057760 [Sclerotinia sclerotiorum 1980 UF-70]EDO00818.1 hypothetical protein SS1G_03292 [Sclerotinia sclerotiorum 1980 UF-70]